MTKSKVINESLPSRDATLNRSDTRSCVAEIANGVSISDEENALLVGIEARLTDEMRRLAGTLREFVTRFQLIRKEIPESAKFCQMVPLFFEFYALQTALVFSQPGNKRIFLDDGATYLKELGLQVDDFVREINLDGRKFLAIAFIDQISNSPLNGTDQLKDC